MCESNGTRAKNTFTYSNNEFSEGCKKASKSVSIPEDDPSQECEEVTIILCIRWFSVVMRLQMT